MFAVLMLTLAQPVSKIEVVNLCPPKIEVVNLCPKAVPAVTAKKTFRSDQFHAGHTCPECGRTQFVISGWLPNGQHRHTCSSGHSWVH